MTTSIDAQTTSMEQRFLAIQKSLFLDALNGVPLNPENSVLTTSLEDYLNECDLADGSPPSETGGSS
jgi:hypothetical protein